MVNTAFRKWIIHRSYKIILGFTIPIHMMWTMWIFFFLLVGRIEVIADLDCIQKNIFYLKKINRESTEWAKEVHYLV